MSDELKGTIIIFDDEPKIVIGMYRKLAREFPEAQILWSLTPDRKPRRDPPKSGKEINNPSWTHPLSASDLVASDVIILDLEMEFASSSDTDSKGHYSEEFGGFNGFYVLDLAERHGCLSKIFVSSAVIDVMRVNRPALARRLEALVTNEEIGVYRKDGKGPESLRVRIYSILDLKRRGYLCSTKTRNKLFLIGSAEALSMEPVLIVGKTGTGKESAAWHIHEMGQRLRGDSHRDLPLMVVHCGGLTPELARDELFGHAKGAFTDASGFKLGSVLKSLGLSAGAARSTDLRAWLLDGNPEQLEATGRGEINLRVTTVAPFGTIFLDEFGELDPSVQALLLRFLNDGEIQPLGYEGTISLKDKEKRLHVRLIGATNRSLAQGLINVIEKTETEPKKTGALTLSRTGFRPVQESSVREDLIFRIARWVVELPEMSPDEIEDLIKLEQVHRADLEEVIWSQEAITKLRELVKAGAFPGQRRELRTIAMRAMAYAKGLATLGMSIYNNESPTVTKEILQDATQPVKIEAEGAPRADRLHAAVCELLRKEKVWPNCQEGFQWKDLRAVPKIDLCRMFLRSLLFVGNNNRQYLFDEIEVAWGIDSRRVKNGTVRNGLRKYVPDALKKELGTGYSEKDFPRNISYKELRIKLRELRGDLEI